MKTGKMNYAGMNYGVTVNYGCVTIESPRLNKWGNPLATMSWNLFDDTKPVVYTGNKEEIRLSEQSRTELRRCAEFFIQGLEQ